MATILILLLLRYFSAHYALFQALQSIQKCDSRLSAPQFATKQVGYGQIDSQFAATFSTVSANPAVVALTYAWLR
ncbi:hypothetical protein [Roseovarius litorisediminis]|uniref:hypothetical protein n=1 Tax=Roseovarius litorisediminis TaxID=1312363 RepID=UPI00111C2498|nr:hypothetical protein [Roseovarius litorisediminis]